MPLLNLNDEPKDAPSEIPQSAIILSKSASLVVYAILLALGIAVFSWLGYWGFIIYGVALYAIQFLVQAVFNKS